MPILNAFSCFSYLDKVQWWQKESGPSAILSKKRTNESETTKQITKKQLICT